MNKSILKPKKVKLMTTRVSPDETKLIQKKADKYAKGNVGYWVRHAAIHHIPKQSELK